MCPAMHERTLRAKDSIRSDQALLFLISGTVKCSVHCGSREVVIKVEGKPGVLNEYEFLTQ
jgi:hypothetical protein